MRTQVGPFEIDFERERVTAAGGEIRLRRQCWDLFALFARRPGDILSKEEISAQLWPDVAVQPNGLNVLLWDLRRSLAKAGSGGIIESCGRRGYRLRSEGTDLATEFPAGLTQAVKDRGPLKLIGRIGELQRLRAGLRTATGGERQLMFVSGEAGIGKSFLIGAFARELAAVKGLRFVQVSCLPLQAAEEPYGAILEAIESIASDATVVEALHQYAPAWLVQLPNLLPPKEMQRLRQSLAGIGAGRLVREVVRLLEHLALRQPLAIVIEDIHWADDGTLDVLASLAARSQATQLLVVVSLRSYDLGKRETQIRNTAYGLIRRHASATRLDLQPFNRVAIEQFLDAAYDHPQARGAVADVLEEASGGNPLFLAALTDSIGQAGWDSIESDILTHAIPNTLREVISERLDRLPGASIPLIEAAAVTGLEFSAAEVAAALSSDVADVERDCARMAQLEQFILAIGEQTWPDGTITGHYRFRHALFQRAVYERCATTLRRTLHARVGRRLASGFRDQVTGVVTRLIRHFEAAGSQEELAAYEEMAAGIAYGRYATKESMVHLERALQTLQRLPDSVERREREARRQLEYANLAIWHEGFSSERARRAYDRAYQLLRIGTKTELLVRAQMGRCLRALMTGDSADDALQIADEILDLTRTAVPQLEAAGHLYAGIVRIPTDLAAALGFYDRALAISEQPGQSSLAVDLRASVLSSRAIALALSGRESEALASADAARAQIRTSDAPGPIASIDAYCACATMLAGAAEDTERIAGEALAIAVDNDITIYGDVLAICLSWARRHQSKQGLAEFERMVIRRAASPERWYQAMFELNLAESLLEAGELDRARSWFDSAVALDETFVRAETWRIRGEFARQRGDAASASESFQHAARIARQQGAHTFARRAVSALRASGSSISPIRG